jgi:cytochrome c biogenesis protein CcmG/thiol:disulfide interchange protein DsbE
MIKTVLRRALARAVLPILSCTLACVFISAFTACNTGDAPMGLIGQSAPALHLPEHPLQSLRGRVVVLNFWASWCGPCLLEFPSLQALQQQMPGVTVLAVSFDKTPQAYETFLQRHHIDLRTALDTTGRSNAAYGTEMPPETWIIDPHGIIRRRFIGPQDWTSPEIESYLRAIGH